MKDVECRHCQQLAVTNQTAVSFELSLVRCSQPAHRFLWRSFHCKLTEFGSRDNLPPCLAKREFQTGVRLGRDAVAPT